MSVHVSPVVSHSFSASEMALVLGFAEKTQILVGNVSRSLELNERLDKNVMILKRLVVFCDVTIGRCIAHALVPPTCLLIAAGLDNPSPIGVTSPAFFDVCYVNVERVSRKEAFGFRSTCVRVSFLAVDFATLVVWEQEGSLVDATPNPRNGSEDHTSREVLLS